MIFKKTFKLKMIILLFCCLLLIFSSRHPQDIESSQITIKNKTYPMYPKALDKIPDIPSPYKTENGMEIVISHTKENKYILVPVTVANDENKGQQLHVNAQDFPTLGRTGLHSELELDLTKTITGRSIEEITELGRPGRLSDSGFMSHNEDIISVLKGDNRIVRKIGLTHPQLARPLYHVYNLTSKNFGIKNYLGYKYHKAEYPPFLYKGKKIFVNVTYTKGGQKSIFDDKLEGALGIKIWRELDKKEKDFLDTKYSHLGEEKMSEMTGKLSHIFTGEMEPYYIMRYGFYEGHTEWRADPIVIAFFFGLRSLEDIEEAFPGKLYETLTAHFTREKN